MSKIVLFNSPKNVGKSKVIEYLNTKGFNSTSADCKASLHKLTMTLFGVTPERYWEIYNTRGLKEAPLPEFNISMTSFYEEYDYLEEILGYSLQGTFLEGEDYETNWELRYKDHPEGAYGTCLNLSIREAMIYVSEVIVKPRWGEDWFGKERVRYIRSVEDTYSENSSSILFTDDSCAFIDELRPLIKHITQENILLIRVHREGYTFEGDSRRYIPDGVIYNTYDVDNNGSEQEYFDKVEDVVRKFLNA